MKIILIDNRGNKKEFENKSKLLEFAQVYFRNALGGESKEIDKIKSETKNISIDDICWTLHGSYRRKY